MESDDDEHSERVLKVVVCGDGASGKTSLCMRFAQDNFGRQYQQTVGLDFFSRRLLLPGNVSVLLQIWDIGGQSIASPMLQKYVFGAHGALVIYDVTNSSSFESLEDWVKIIKKFTKTQEKPPQLALVGNKTDLEHRRAVRIEKHTKFAEQHGMTSHYVSAKTGDSVTLLFRAQGPSQLQNNELHIRSVACFGAHYSINLSKI
ncbi:Ras-related protein Rab-28 [Toxocara canis]|uniref:Ras-related protein Rab-28 n=1 Tax=Toxocara canis TaxID=6265 RepID=A0A0B2V3E4_TOXCA|nr:Ras-related protein Rab-28 [Toxocara canis]